MGGVERNRKRAIYREGVGVMGRVNIKEKQYKEMI